VFVCTHEKEIKRIKYFWMVLIFYNLVWAIFFKPGLTQAEHRLEISSLRGHNKKSLGNLTHYLYGPLNCYLHKLSLSRYFPFFFNKQLFILVHADGYLLLVKLYYKFIHLTMYF
jgi:hypothetical protein